MYSSFSIKPPLPSGRKRDTNHGFLFLMQPPLQALVLELPVNGIITRDLLVANEHYNQSPNLANALKLVIELYCWNCVV